MGADIHSHIERQTEAGTWAMIDGREPFGDRSYAVFGFLADVRNYSAVTPLADPRDLPDDVSPEVAAEYASWGDDAHSASWFTAAELAAVDYGQDVNDRRVTRQTGPRSFDGGATGTPDEGKVMPLREFLGASFVRDVEHLTTYGDPERVRVVFWFDN